MRQERLFFFLPRGKRRLNFTYHHQYNQQPCSKVILVNPLHLLTDHYYYIYIYNSLSTLVWACYSLFFIYVHTFNKNIILILSITLGWFHYHHFVKKNCQWKLGQTQNHWTKEVGILSIIQKIDSILFQTLITIQKT